MNQLMYREKRDISALTQYEGVIVFGAGSHISEVVGFLKSFTKVLSVCDSSENNIA